MFRFWILVIIASLFLAACSHNKGGLGLRSGGTQQGKVAPVAEGQVAPDFTLENFDGQKVSLASTRGKAVLVDFWAAWCPFCIEEMPEIEKISQEFGPPAGGDLVVLGIHRTETESTQNGAKFAKDRGVTYPLLKDSDGSLYKAYTGGRNFMPVAAFIDRDGKVVKLIYGPKTEDQMRQYVRQALGQAI